MDKKEAARYFIESADKGNDMSMFYYGKMLFNGDGIERNEKEAIKYFYSSADKGNSSSMC